MGSSAASEPSITRFLRFQLGVLPAYGILLNGDRLRQIRGDLFENWEETKDEHQVSRCKLLYPCEPRTIFAVGRNFKSHIGEKREPTRPEIFFKPVSSLQNPEDSIVIPKGANNVHFEGELVLVIGRKARGLSVEEAREAIFGVTCGNDVSERDWQIGPDRDLQWWRAKGADTFAPLGPVIVRGLDYSNLLIRTWLNGKTVQEQSTADMFFDPPTIVSWISQHVTLTPGDVIYTGTPGTTQKMNPGDVVEVEIEGIGTLRNPVVAG
jgi:2-keto-4-pentenoate hydratase/2-oxohepta-3-ene-1,7-dioic acid hydratase in catechol pathway